MKKEQLSRTLFDRALSKDKHKHKYDAQDESYIYQLISDYIDSYLVPINIDETFEFYVRECYKEEETDLRDIHEIIEYVKTKRTDEWERERDNYIKSLIEDYELLEYGNGRYYWREDVEHLAKHGTI